MIACCYLTAHNYYMESVQSVLCACISICLLIQNNNYSHFSLITDEIDSSYRILYEEVHKLACFTLMLLINTYHAAIVRWTREK